MKKLIRIIVAAVLLVAAVVVERSCALPTWQLLMVYMVPYLIVGYDVIAEAVEGIIDGDPFDENFLMVVASAGAMAIGFMPGASNAFTEGVFVMLFFQVGELFEHYAEDRSRQSITQMMDLRPDTATVVRGGEPCVVTPEEVGVGDVLLVKPGEKIAVDGVVMEGRSTLSTVALTGESMPREVSEGDEVISGCVNLQGVLRIEARKCFGESTAAKIIDMVENAAEKKSKAESFITRFAQVYTPIVVLLALALALVPPLWSESYFDVFYKWLYRALTFLVVSCPCALVISVPLTFFAGIGGASRRGILVKGGNYMDVLAKLKTVVFDKTGTLTHGVFEVVAVHPETLSERELLHMAAHVEAYSTHPLAAVLREAYKEECKECSVSDVKEVAGQGVVATVNGKRVAVGNGKLMEAVGAQWHDCHLSGTVIHVAMDGVYVGHVVASDHVKEDAAQAISELHGYGVERTVMLTGDYERVAEEVAQEVGVTEYHAQLLPADKVAHVERLMAERQQDGTLAFVGDGINDAPVLARADVGIAMGAMGSDAAIEAADVVLMDDRPRKIADAIGIARRTLGIARQNVVFAITVKVIILVLSAVGLTGMGLAVFGDVGVMVLCVLNAMRALKM